MELKREQIIIRPDAEFHMLRHFQVVSSDIIDIIRKNGYCKAEILQMVMAPGSRFSGAFAQSIDALLERILHYPYTVDTGVTGNLEASWDIPKDEWPFGIGTYAVISIEVLDERQLKKLYKKENRGVIAWHLDVEVLPYSNQCTLILKPIDEYFLFITAFPGSTTMPMPDLSMSEEIYTACKEYWDRHVFMVSI